MISMIDACDAILRRHMPDAPSAPSPRAETELGKVGHLRWMLTQCELLLARDQVYRAGVWLGFVHGQIVARGWATISDLQLLDIVG
jgi:hypothetical protein